MNDQRKIESISSRAIPLTGNDIDTDRIIPARFLKCVVFDTLGPHAFEDDRAALKEKGKTHVFDNPLYQGAGILVVENNFGCGSSREHAPQSLMRWGIKAIVGVSFAEIFFGNCVSLGVPCVTLDAPKIQTLLKQIEQNPNDNWTLDIQEGTFKGTENYKVKLDEGVRDQFLQGHWNPLDGLLAAKNAISQVAQNIPYL